MTTLSGRARHRGCGVFEPGTLSALVSSSSRRTVLCVSEQLFEKELRRLDEAEEDLRERRSAAREAGDAAERRAIAGELGQIGERRDEIAQAVDDAARSAPRSCSR